MIMPCNNCSIDTQVNFHLNASASGWKKNVAFDSAVLLMRLLIVDIIYFFNGWRKWFRIIILWIWNSIISIVAKMEISSLIGKMMFVFSSLSLSLSIWNLIKVPVISIRINIYDKVSLCDFLIFATEHVIANNCQLLL